MVVNARAPAHDRGRRTRTQLVETARGLFGERGYAATSLDEVVERAGVTKGALYHHFAGKADLFAAVYEAVKRDLAREVADAQMPPAPWDSLVAGCRRWVEVHTRPGTAQIVLVDARAVLTSSAWQEIDARWGTVIIRSALRRAMVHGVIESLPLVPLARLVQGAYTEACMLVVESDDREEAREVAIGVATRLLEGLRVSESRS